MTQTEFLAQLRTIAESLPLGGAAMLPRDFLLAGVAADTTQKATTPPSAASTKWGTAHDACALLGVKRSTIYGSFGRQFSKRVGHRMLRYDLDAIEKHMRRARTA